MCHFIATTLPADVDMQRVRAVVKQHGGMALAPLANRSLLSQLPPGEHVFRATASQCDCGTVLGMDNRRLDPKRQRDHGRQVADLRRKGWSTVKIERWLEARARVLERDARVQRERGPAWSGPSLETWQTFLEALLREGGARHVGLLLHAYRGPLEDEPITIVEQRAIPYDRITPDVLRALDDDVLNLFGARSVRT